MQFNAKVSYNVSHYMGSDFYYEENFQVEAESEDEAEAKIKNYFKEKDSPYSTTYWVSDIEFFTRID